MGSQRTIISVKAISYKSVSKSTTIDIELYNAIDQGKNN